MKQNVGVIFSSTHRQDLHVVIFADSCEIGPEARLQFFFYDFAAVFGAEDEVHVILGECVGQWAAPCASRRPQADGASSYTTPPPRASTTQRAQTRRVLGDGGAALG